MLKAYLNYPQSKVSVHRNPSCSNIEKMSKPNQRSVQIDLQKISEELQRFSENEHKFASEAKWNDMWITIDFDDPDFEDAVLAYVHRLISKRYSPFARIRIERPHC